MNQRGHQDFLDMRFYRIVLFLGFVIPKEILAYPAVVEYIFDGDTFAADVILDEDIKVATRIRLINVDTPEIHGECDYEVDMANKAKERLTELLPIGSVVELKEIKDDKYLGRIDARVFTADNEDVGEILIKEKLGRRYSGGKRLPWCK